MRKLLCIFVVVLNIWGCSQKSQIILSNKTNYNIYYALDDHQYILQADETQTHTYQITKKNLLRTPTQKVKVKIEGETYARLYNSIEMKEFQITVDYDETYHLNLEPSHAGLRVDNISPHTITQIYYLVQKPTNDGKAIEILHGESLLPGANYFWCRLEENNNIGLDPYNFQIDYISGEDGSYGRKYYDEQIYIKIGEQHKIVFEG